MADEIPNLMMWVIFVRTPKTLAGKNPVQMQLANRSILLKLLRANESACRKDLAEMSGLTGAAVTNLIRDLVNVGLINEDKNYSGPRSRNAVALRFNYDDFLVIGVSFKRGSLCYAVANLGGRFLETEDIPLRMDEPVSEVLQTLDRIIRDCIVKYETQGNIIGLGVSVPGPIDLEKGEIPRLTNLPGWNAIPIQSFLEERYTLPIILDDNANSAVLAEKWFGCGANYDNMISVLVSNGVGAGVIIDGDIYHGTFGFAGEFGHVSIDFEGPQCECGNSGCVELYCSALSLLRNAKSLRGESNITGLADVIDRVNRGDENLSKMVAESGKYLGYAIVNLVNLFNPELVVVHGKMLKFGALWMESIRDSVQQRLLPEVADRLVIQPTALKQDPVTTGTIAMVCEHIINNPQLSYFARKSKIIKA